MNVGHRFCTHWKRWSCALWCSWSLFFRLSNIFLSIHLSFSGLFFKCFHNLTFSFMTATNTNCVEDIKRRIDEVKVVGVTCLGINHPLLANKKFDICIMDEAGQITLPVCTFLFFRCYACSCEGHGGTPIVRQYLNSTHASCLIRLTLMWQLPKICMICIWYGFIFQMCTR